MRVQGRALLAALVVLLAIFAGCSGGERESGAGNTPGDGTGASSDVADAAPTPSSRVEQSRGVATVERHDDDGLQPLVVLDEIIYEWRLTPQRGLQVSLGFLNPNDTYERARGYLFAIASSRASSGSVYGVYPWNAKMGSDGLPADYTEGTHLLYRRDQGVRAFIPYENASGFYDVLRVLVYSESGEVLIDNTVSLEVHGEATGPLKPPVDLIL
jgi:hypothetical protein